MLTTDAKTTEQSTGGGLLGRFVDDVLDLGNAAGNKWLDAKYQEPTPTTSAPMTGKTYAAGTPAPVVAPVANGLNQATISIFGVTFDKKTLFITGAVLTGIALVGVAR